MRSLTSTLLLTTLIASIPAPTRASTDQALAEFLARNRALAALGDGGSVKSASADRIMQSGFESDTSCESDTDGDGLPDCAETGTGVYVDLADTGTDPEHADTDGDGLGDGEELFGTAAGLDLPALGVSPLRRDLLVEYDWFEDDACGLHSHAPSAEVLARVAAVFAAAPVVNPDGSMGIHLVQDAGQGGALSGGNLVEGHAAVLPGRFDATWEQIKQDNFAPERRGAFRYVLLAHHYDGGSGSSGYAEVVGDDALVTLGCDTFDHLVARTIVHEVGHLLGLLHGGFEQCNGKPNYNSLMNYRYQFVGIDASCVGYGDGSTDGLSRGNRVQIDEADVDEALGVCGTAPIDWNQNGAVETGIALDLNAGHAESCGESLQVLRDFDDWAHITFFGIQDGQALPKSLQQETACAGAPLHGH